MVAAGTKVKTHYRGTLDDGTQFDSSYDRGEPLAFTAGVGQMIPGFDKAVLEMELGEKRTVRLEPAEAYGEYNEAYIELVPVDLLPNSEKLPIGEMIVLRTPQGPMQVKVLKVEDGMIHFDHNHELAGQALTFEIELVEVG